MTMLVRAVAALSAFGMIAGAALAKGDARPLQARADQGARADARALAAAEEPQRLGMPTRQEQARTEALRRRQQEEREGIAATSSSTTVVRLEALGLEVSRITLELRRQFNLSRDIKGVLITKVETGGPAADRGIEAGEVIEEINSAPVSSPEEMQKRIDTLQKEGRSSALLRIATSKGRGRFSALPVPPSTQHTPGPTADAERTRVEHEARANVQTQAEEPQRLGVVVWQEQARAEAQRRQGQVERERLAAQQTERERAEQEARANVPAQAEAEEPRRLGVATWQEQTQAETEERRRREVAARQEQARNAIPPNPNSSTGFWARGNTHKERNEIDLAIADYTEAIRLDPTRSYVFLDRGIAYHEKGDYDRAIADYNEAIRLTPNNVAALSGRGLAHQEKGDFDRAIADFSEAILLKPDDYWLLKLRGTALHLKGDYDRAIAEFTAITRLKPDTDAAIARGRAYEVLMGRGAAYREKGNLTQALADLNEAVRLAPTYFEPYVDRGLTHVRMGDHAQAIADFETALRLNPDVENARKGEARKALDQSRAALAKGPASAPPTSPELVAKAPAAHPADPVMPSAPQELAKAPEAQTVAPSPVEPTQKTAVIPVINETRVALVIGNSAYSAVRALPNPARDAQAVAEALRGAGFKTVTVATDLGRSQLLETLEAFADQAEMADWAVVYFAGHGLELNGTNFLIPVDARLKTDRSVLDEAVPLERVTMAIERAKKLRLIVLDACRDNPFASQMRMTVATRSVSRGLARIEPEGGTLVAYAAKHGQVALDGDEQNSPFVAALVKRMATPGIEVRRLFGLVRDDVLAATGRRQEPFVYGALGGDEFFFRPPQAN